MKLSQLLKYQLVYALTGISYNIVSLVMVSTGSRALSTTSPFLGITTLSIYALCLLFGRYGCYKAYRLLMLLSIIGFGFAGIILHVLNYPSLHLYYSPLAWVLAIAINVAGLILNFIALTSRFDAQGMPGTPKQITR